MKALIIVLVAISILTGVFHSIHFSSFHVNFFVGSAYFCGFLGLYLIMKSVQHKTLQKRYLTFFIGLANLLMAHMFLQDLIFKMEKGK